MRWDVVAQVRCYVRRPGSYGDGVARHGIQQLLPLAHDPCDVGVEADLEDAEADAGDVGIRMNGSIT